MDTWRSIFIPIHDISSSFVFVAFHKKTEISEIAEIQKKNGGFDNWCKTAYKMARSFLLFLRYKKDNLRFCILQFGKILYFPNLNYFFVQFDPTDLYRLCQTINFCV